MLTGLADGMFVGGYIKWWKWLFWIILVFILQSMQLLRAKETSPSGWSMGSFCFWFFSGVGFMRWEKGRADPSLSFSLTFICTEAILCSSAFCCLNHCFFKPWGHCFFLTLFHSDCLSSHSFSSSCFQQPNLLALDLGFVDSQWFWGTVLQKFLSVDRHSLYLPCLD